MNSLVIAAAGSGKTTFLIKEALSVPSEENILITTYTENNTQEIKKKIISRKGYIPDNIYIKPWFSFLLMDCVRPFQDVLDPSLHDKSIGFVLVNNQTNKFVSKQKNKDYYFCKDKIPYDNMLSYKITSDKLSDFIIETNKKENCILSRLERCYKHIFIDEVQDLAGYDLEIIKCFLESKMHILLVGDPRQTVCLTNNPKKNSNYSEGKIKDYLLDNVDDKYCTIDEASLGLTHRNIQDIANLSSKLFSNFSIPKACTCSTCHNPDISHRGCFFIHNKDAQRYCDKINPVILRWNVKTVIARNTLVYNMGESKGLTFDHVLIYPTKDMISWLKNNNTELKFLTKSKLYVAITRARYSVCFVLEDNERINNDLQEFIL